MIGQPKISFVENEFRLTGQSKIFLSKFTLDTIIISLSLKFYNIANENKSLDAFKLGWFLHLVTDYLFFEECFTEEYLLNTSYNDFCRDLYFAYDHLNLYLTQKYHISKDDYKDYPSEYYQGFPYENCILSKETVDAFINRISSIDLDKYIKKIQKHQSNIKP